MRATPSADASIKCFIHNLPKVSLHSVDARHRPFLTSNGHFFLLILEMYVLYGPHGGAYRPRADGNYGEQRRPTVPVPGDRADPQDRDIARFSIQHQRILIVRRNSDKPRIAAHRHHSD